LRAWILEVWLALEAPAYLENHTDLEDAKAYFDLLDELAVGCTIKSFAELEERASLLFASSGQFETGAVQVMTVHRAKGLEFDTVFLPGLERVSPSKAQQLLSWAERPSRYGDDLILAPIRKRGDRGDTIYRYLCYQESRKDQFERSRLLYVAATRAKKRLYLFGSIDGDLRPPKNSFLSLLCKIN
jgi:ATP-dependent helicase/nuclease subunit A